MDVFAPPGGHETAEWHAMIIIGVLYDKGLRHWLLRNSWGENGHIKVTDDYVRQFPPPPGCVGGYSDGGVDFRGYRGPSRRFSEIYCFDPLSPSPLAALGANALPPKVSQKSFRTTFRTSRVESKFTVSVDPAYLFLPLSSGGASRAGS